MISPEAFYGGAIDLGALTDDVAINTVVGRRVVNIGEAAGYSIELPSTIDPPRQGGPLLYVLNNGSTVADVGGTNIAAGKAAIVLRGSSSYRIAEVDIL